MAKDYKYRTEHKNFNRRRYSTEASDPLALWKWMLITGLIIGGVVLAFYQVSKHLKPAGQTAQTVSKTAQNAKNEIKPGSAPESAPKETPKTQFEFYTVLTDQEAVVPDHEIDTRSREERVGQAKVTQYHMQAGSYQDLAEAEAVQAKLGQMGIESRIEKAKVGDALWYNIEMGPYTRMSSVSTIHARLRESGIDVIVKEPKR